MKVAAQLESTRLFDPADPRRLEAGRPDQPLDFLAGTLLGNFPQAFSHIGLVNAAWAISEAERDPA